MPNNWYSDGPKYGKATWVPSKLCENNYCLYGKESGKAGRSDNIERTHIEYGPYWGKDYEYYKCNHCGYNWREESY